MPASTLKGPSQPPRSGKAPKQIILLLHGYGSNGNDLFGLVPEFAPHFPDALFLSPDAPFACEINPFGGYQWFSMREYTLQAMLGGAVEAAPILDDFITEQLARYKLSEKNLALIGFSQGTMMSLYIALRRAKQVAGVVGFSGTLLSSPAQIVRETVSKPPVCLVHGTADSVVPFHLMSMTENALASAGIKVEAHARPGLSHSIDAEGMEIAVEFLKKSFA